MPKKKKDILFLCQYFYPEHNSSATLPFDTAKYLAQNGFSVGAMVGYPKEYSDDRDVPMNETKDGVEITRLKYLQLKRSGKIGRLINYFSFTAKCLTKERLLKQYRSVIVYSNPPILPILPLIAKKRYNIRLVFVAYDVYPEVAFASKSLSKSGLITKVMSKINHYLYRYADCIVALTDEMKEYLLSNRKELSDKRIVTIPNWAHEDAYEVSDDAYERFGYNKDQFIVSYFGNMGICQDIDTMMKAAEYLKDNDDIKFLIVGHGNKKEIVKQIIQENHLSNVQLLDFLVGEDFRKAVAISSCSIVSLEKGLKGTCAPSKYYSYLQGGQPVLAVVEEDSYLAEEVEKRKIGKYVRLGDGLGMSRIITELAADSDECEKLGNNARQLYEQTYAMDIGMKKYQKLFKRILMNKEK